MITAVGAICIVCGIVLTLMNKLEQAAMAFIAAILLGVIGAMRNRGRRD